MDLFIKQIEDRYMRENFEKLQRAINEMSFFQGEFEFFEFDIEGAVANKQLYHGLGFTPNDVLVTRAVGANYELNYNSLNENYLGISTAGDLYLRCFIGNMKKGERTGTFATQGL